ncbi:putative protein N(5)-glutamine methyltransferase [Planomicrobium sp. CPCC 101079]|uniref:putative protein N(5)-glutamine methyltransferase n=1 Tax=Planomicrobium sp. CPCC 101079 TaxID=2599618 RepID=UPI0011B443DD|nr:putative protein N(5)-glutamine methyltransferase [Planomicrobium sp. CPCC 101079]TWT09350.1 putative protein N(5)-glutamine methyltransferase [Planomicrobium sp. CPCC 101079]
MGSKKARKQIEQISGKLRSAGCVFAEEEARLLVSAARSAAELSSMVNKRLLGEPLEHVIGWAHFYGLKLEVCQTVFVPRRRTEFLVHQSLSAIEEGAVILDLCCGSGAIGAAIASQIQVELHGVDIEPDAVQCARRNLLSIDSCIYEGDLFEPLPDTLKNRFNLIVANAPYVPTELFGRLPAEARNYEARSALDGGEDGLFFHRRIAADAASWLAPGGKLLVEVSRQQASKTVAIFEKYGLAGQVASSEEFDATVVSGTRPFL